jgi:hypothetical protein
MANAKILVWKDSLIHKVRESISNTFDFLSVRIGPSALEIKETSGRLDVSGAEVSGLAAPTQDTSAVTLEYFKSNASGVAYGQTRLADDFISGAVSSVLGWNSNSNGTNAGVAQDSTLISATHPGVVRVSSGTLLSGRASLNLGPAGSAIVFGSGVEWVQEWYVQVSHLYDTNDRYTLIVGYGNNVTATPTNGVYFFYNGAISARWQLITKKAGVTTTVTTSTNVVAGSWLKMRIVTNGTASSFWVNDTLIGSINTNHPQLAAEAVAPMVYIQKSKGLNPRHVYVDKFFLTGTY